MSTKYAENTSVPVDRSRTEIENTLMRYGADGFSYATNRVKSVITFQAHDKIIRFELILPTLEDFEETPTGRTRSQTDQKKALDQELRRRWRSLALAVKAKLEVVEVGISTFEEEFMAKIVLPNNKTVGEFILPEINRAYEAKEMPNLLPEKF